MAYSHEKMIVHALLMHAFWIFISGDITNTLPQAYSSFGNQGQTFNPSGSFMKQYERAPFSSRNPWPQSLSSLFRPLDIAFAGKGRLFDLKGHT